MENVKAFALLGFGYLLLYAAVFKKGKYASHPWAALLEGSSSQPNDPPIPSPGSPWAGGGGPFQGGPGGSGGGGGGGGGGW